MTYPTPVQLDANVRTLTTTNWASVGARLLNLIDRDRRGGSAIPDGYPPSTEGGSGTSELTSVEAAVHARAQGHRDEHHDRTMQAIVYWGDVLRALAACVTQLDRAEARVYQPEGLEPGCNNCAIIGEYTVRHRGDLCERCYRFKLKYGKAPSVSLLEDRARGIHWTTASISRALRDDRV